MQKEDINIETINLAPIKPKTENISPNRFKFTEIMLVLSALGVVVFLALLAINPKKEAAEARNLKRSADISMILSYVGSYVSTWKEVPDEIPGSKVCVEFGNEICRTGPYDCTDLVNMNFLTKYDVETLLVMPNDPLYISMNGTGYFISNDGEGYITVCAPHAERNEHISFSKYVY